MAFSELIVDNDKNNIFKGLSGAVFIAPKTASPITSILDATTKEIKALPADWKNVGLLSSDGMTFSADVEEEEVTSLGYASPTRTDVVGRTREITFTAQEALRDAVFELAYGVTAPTPSANGEVTFDLPELPDRKEYQLFAIAEDKKTGAYVAKFFPSVVAVSEPEESWNASDPLVYEFTFRAQTSQELGTSERVFIVK